MPTYQETVLADNPVVYLRLDVLGPGATGTTVPDISGNGLDGSQTYTATGGEQSWGFSSPIETDGASREFRGWNNAGLISGLSGTNYISVPHDPLLQPTTDFWVEEWLRVLHDIPLAGTFLMVGKSGSCGTMLTFSGGTRIGGFCIDTAGTVWTVHDPTFLVTDHIGESFHVVVVRQGATLGLYVNGELRNTTTITSGLNTQISSNAFFVHPNSSFALDCRHDEAAMGTEALGADRVLAHYEAAKNELLSTATITVRVVVELDTDQVDPIDFPFVHNFAEPLSGSPRPIVEHLAWKTNVLQSEPDYKQRINAQPHHVERTLEYFVTPTSARARAMLQAALWTPGQVYKLPIGKDWGELTAQATAGAGTISLDTILKDYEIGSHVVVWEDVTQPWTAQFFEITSRTDLQLSVSPNVGSTLPTGSPVMPARLAILPEDSLSVDSHLIDRETHALQFEILSTELSSRRDTAYTPAETYLSLEVFRLERAKVEWVDPSPYQLTRRQEGIGTATGNDYLRAIDTGSPQTVPLRVLLPSDAAISEFYGWMDARAGKVNPVWIVSEESDLEVIARTGTTITANHIGYAAHYNAHSARRHLAFKKTDGSTVYKIITAAVDNGDATETLTVASPPALADIVKTSFLKLCTAPDQFELTYHRNGSGFIGECEFVMMELLTTPES